MRELYIEMAKDIMAIMESTDFEDNEFDDFIDALSDGESQIVNNS